MTEASGDAVTADVGRFDVELPTDWDRTVPGGSIMLLARARTWPGPFTPTINITRTHTPGVATLADYVEAQLTGIANAVGGHLVHLASSYRPRPHLDLTLAIESVGIDLTVTQRHLVGAPHPDASGCASVVATAVAADCDWPSVAPALVSAVRSLRVAER